MNYNVKENKNKKYLWDIYTQKSVFERIENLFCLFIYFIYLNLRAVRVRIPILKQSELEFDETNYYNKLLNFRS